MSRKKDVKTNAMRIVDAAGLDHEVHVFEATSADTGFDIAQRAGEDPAHVFKTLVLQGKSGEHLVFMIPVAEELDLKKAARVAGEKSVAMVKSRELFDLTGYVHGGCSPLGMKKPFRTFIDETCVLFDTILFSGGKIGTQIEMSADDLGEVIDITMADLVVDAKLTLRAVYNSRIEADGSWKGALMGEVKFFRCEHCGNIVTKIINGGPAVFCCGEKMVELIPDSSDGAGEKHVPVITVEEGIATVKVGSEPHPMIEEHYIQWICLHTEKGLQFVWLNPGEAPEAIFAVAPDDKVIEAYAYCNIHGLWVSA